jgi:hypothetical protein
VDKMLGGAIATSHRSCEAQSTWLLAENGVAKELIVTEGSADTEKRWLGLVMVASFLARWLAVKTMFW